MKDGDRTPGDTPGAPGAAAEAPSASGGPSPTPDEAGGWRRSPFRPVLALMVLVLLGLLATAGFKSYRDLDAAKTYERQLIEEIAAAEERVRELDGRIDSIRHDPMTLERLAREDLGMVRAGDLVIVLPEPQPAAAPSPPRAPDSPP